MPALWSAIFYIAVRAFFSQGIKTSPNLPQPNTLQMDTVSAIPPNNTGHSGSWRMWKRTLDGGQRGWWRN